MLENVIIREIHATRFIMSYVRKGGKLRGPYGNFNDWLKSLGLTEEERKPILDLAGCGKLELEISAKAFLENTTNETHKES